MDDVHRNMLLGNTMLLGKNRTDCTNCALPFMWMKSLRGRLLCVVAAVVVAATMMVAIVATWTNANQITVNNLHRIRAIADAVGEVSASALIRDDIGSLYEALQTITDIQALGFVRVYQTRTEAVIDSRFPTGPASSNSSLKGRNPLSADASEALLELARAESETVVYQEDAVLVVHPIIRDERHLGAAIVSMPRPSLLDLCWTTFGRLISIVVMICLVALAMTHFLIQRALRPVTALTNAAIGVGQGLLHVDLPSSCNDEIGKLSGAFSQMVATIRRNYERIHQLAFHDSVTHLPNRALFRKELDQLMAQRLDQDGYIFFIDLDRFKWVNDSFGHDYGDQLLRTFGSALQRQAEEFSFDIAFKRGLGDTCDETVKTPLIARFGGDEFALLVYPGYTRDEVEQFADAILQTFVEPLEVGGQPVRIGASIGISVFPEAEAADMVLKQADMAMYDAKQRGGHDYRFFSREMDAHLNARLAMERDLRVALEQDQFELYYQPKVDCKTGQPVGLEALIRWNHPELGIISPAEFIPLAEEIGIITTLGTWVLQEACCQTALWNEKGYEITIAVNLSAAQFESLTLIDEVEEALMLSGLDPARLELEITESMMMADPNGAADIIALLRERGIRFAIDDFGTGYSSLSYLTNLPLDAVKIDRSFIAKMTGDESSRMVVETILALARNLNFETVAEGVESPEHIAFLAESGCSLAQGFLFSRPVPAGECDLWLAENTVPAIIPLPLTGVG